MLHFTVVSLFGQHRTDILSKTNVEQLGQIAIQFESQYQQMHDRAIEWAQRTGSPLVVVTPDGKVREIVGIDNGNPIFYGTNNLNAVKTTSTDKIQVGGSTGLDLTGNDFTIGIWDAGKVRTTHQEFELQSGGSRVTLIDTGGNFHDHSTHVAGTMIAVGISNYAKGMAIEGLLDSWNWSNDESEMAAAAADGLLLSNHSYGRMGGWSYSGSAWYWFGDININSHYCPT